MNTPIALLDLLDTLLLAQLNTLNEIYVRHEGDLYLAGQLDAMRAAYNIVHSLAISAHSS